MYDFKNTNTMKKITYLLIIMLVCNQAFTQSKNFIDQAYLETTAKVDTLVVPDQIFLSIYIDEGEDRNKTSLEKQEREMAKVLENLGIDLKKQLKLQDLTSAYKKYFLKRKNVLKSKLYALEVYDAMTAGKVLIGLENIGISNVALTKTAFSKMESLKLTLKSKAILKAKSNGMALTGPLNQVLGKAIYISDQYQSNPYYKNHAMLVEVAEESETKSSVETPINIGFSKIKLECQISVKFALN
jgi:uncharacterized protein YggE